SISSLDSFILYTNAKDSSTTNLANRYISGAKEAKSLSSNLCVIVCSGTLPFTVSISSLSIFFNTIKVNIDTEYSGVYNSDSKDVGSSKLFKGTVPSLDICIPVINLINSELNSIKNSSRNTL